MDKLEVRPKLKSYVLITDRSADKELMPGQSKICKLEAFEFFIALVPAIT